MAKKSKQKVFDNNLKLENLKVGMTLLDSTRNPKEWEIEDSLIEQMKQFEQKTTYNALWKGKLTGHFIYYKYIEEHPEYLEEKEKAKAERVEKMIKARQAKKEAKIEEIEEEVKDEEDLMLDAVEDYKSKYSVDKVNTDSKKFKAFFEEWKKSN